MTAPPVVSDEAKRLYGDYIAEINKREVSSCENFDKSVLTFSSAGLALSIGYLKDFVSIQIATAPWMLYTSWALLTLAMCVTVTSFRFSNKALERQKGYGHAYYMEGDEGAFNRKNYWDVGTRAFNWLSGVFFLLGTILSVVFISINLEKGSAMKDNAKPYSTGCAEPVEKGLAVPPMQKVPPVPAQPAPSQSPPSEPKSASPKE